MFFYTYVIFSFIALLNCFKILYTLGWVRCVSCSKCVANSSQEALSTSHFCLASAAFLLYPVLSRASLMQTISYMMFHSFLLIALFGHLIFLNIFLCRLFIFFNFCMLLIFVCFVSFLVLSQHQFRLFLCCLSEDSVFVCTTIFCFRQWKVLFLKISPFSTATL